MSAYGRSIKVAFDKLSGEILEADDVFEITKDAFSVRRQFHMDEVELYCCECDQKLYVSTSKYDRLHFKHGPNANYCFLKDANLSPEEKGKFSRIYHAKESPRHHELKNKIGKALLNVPGVDKESVAIDNKFIIKGGEKRRPDVYCNYEDKELVFEIQLSDLSLRYILSRYNFYKKHGIYLIWILDNFDIHNQGQLERDIKYLTKFENFFKLDETKDIFSLECQYKFPFLTDDNKLLTKWLTKSVALNQIKFDTVDYQIFYYNLDRGRTTAEEEQLKKSVIIKEQKREKAEQAKLLRASSTSDKLISTIKDLKKRKVCYYLSVNNLINELDSYELEVFNNKLALKERKKPALIEWIVNAENEDNSFIEFIVRCEKIKFDINDACEDGLTVFHAIYKNDNIHKNTITKAILERGYKFTASDLSLIDELPKTDSEGLYKVGLFNVIKRVNNRMLIEQVYKHDKLVLIIESARLKTITGFKYKADQWVAFANNAVQYHSEYWEYIESAFKYYGLWETIIAQDKKLSFQNKVTEFYKNMPIQKFDFEMIYSELYPELAF